jgi:peptide methionine sulfoxide reductase msrA/msrB
MQRIVMIGLGLILAIIMGMNISAQSVTPQTPKLAQAPKLDNAAVQKDMPASKQIETIVLGAGCFWGAEKRYEAIPGVLDAVSGYADGNGIEPTYNAITRPENKFNPNNFAEVVQVTFNPTVVNIETILKNYFEGHDPTQLDRQGNDVGTQYRSTILTKDAKQQQIAEQVKTEFQQLLSAAGYGKITTVIKPLKKFYPAEDYHQDYLVKNPNGYCPDHSTGVKFAAAKVTTPVDNESLKQGKQIIVIESDSYCPYCEKFKKDVTDHYQGDIKIHSRLASQLDGLTIKTPTWATPTILFLENGNEVFGRQGYLSRDEFYHALGLWKLGKSEAYNVAFDEGTDTRFCRQYEIFKNTPDGVFVDKLSGAPLFDTRDRFDSGTGWLSFTKTVKDAVIEREDNRYGMQRVEIRSKSSGIHLGHVFQDGPNGMPRYCINATVLDFVPRERLNKTVNQI